MLECEEAIEAFEPAGRDGPARGSAVGGGEDREEVPAAEASVPLGGRR
jgi:hypothetical protein